MLNQREAAQYCGLNLKRFPVACPVSPLSMPDGGKLYDMRDLDGWLDALKGGAAGEDEILRMLD